MSASAARLPFVRVVCCLVLAMTLGACRTVLESRSPWNEGIGIKISPTVALGDGEAGPTLHPTASYTRVNGGINWVEAGAQVRWPFTAGDREIWVGVEALVGHSGTTGVAASALVGVPIFAGNSWRPSLFASAGLTRYGGTGKVLSLGVDIQPQIFDLR